MSKGWKLVCTLLVAAVLLWFVGCGPEPEIQPMGVTSLDSLHLSDTGGTATPVFIANQSGTGAIAVFQDATTPVASFYDGGTLDMHNYAISNVGAAGTDFGADGSLTTAAGITISNGDAVVADDLRITAQTELSVTNGAAFTATGTYQPIAAAAEVTPTITMGTAGDVLMLVNAEANTINIADSGTTMLSAAIALGQYDTLTLWCDGTNWLELSRTNN